MDASSRSGSPRWGQHFPGAASGIGGAAPAPSQCGTAGWIPGAAGAANPAAGARHVWHGGVAGEKGEGRTVSMTYFAGAAEDESCPATALLQQMGLFLPPPPSPRVR